MARPAGKDIAVKSALAQLWCIDELCDEDKRFFGQSTLDRWIKAEHSCKRWVAVVAAGGRAADLPPDLIRNKAFFNGRDWRIP